MHGAEAETGVTTLNRFQNIMTEILCRVYHFSFLSSGDSFTGLKARFRTGKLTIHDVVVEKCQAIWDVLKEEVLPVPTPEHWRKIEEGFRIRLHFPNCIGALDGKHIRIKARANTASLFHNYKVISPQFFWL